MAAGMTKVQRRHFLGVLALATLLSLSAGLCTAQAKAASGPELGPAARLYQELGSVGLDPARVYHVRDASIERPGAHLTLEDGTIAFTQDVMGKITGAFFEGDGEVLVAPPNDAERQSMSLFTGMAILEERFSSAYFRFNDNTAAEFSPGLRATEDAVEFCERWKDAAAGLAQSDAMRLLLTFSRGLADSNGVQRTRLDDPGDQFLHARLQGNKLGIFDVIYDSSGSEPLEVGQARKSRDGSLFYDAWASFSPASSGNKRDSVPVKAVIDPIHLTHISIRTHVKPPRQIEAEATLQLETRQAGQRALMFELSRFIRVQAVERDGHPVEFIHNPSVEGTQLARRGNDVVAVILDRPSEVGQTVSLRFVYRGEVLADAGPGLLYVGARGNWYPNRGPTMANYELEFHYPPGWTLVATGKPVPSAAPSATEQTSRWTSDRPIPVAGFNLGRYKRATAHAGNVLVESYGAAAVERDFPTAAPQMTDPTMVAPVQPPIGLAPAAPSPALNTQLVADAAATAIRFYAERFGPYPYSQLALTQLPGSESQGWPGLVFLSSFAFLTDAERDALHKSDISKILERQIPAHETAHQWWGDLITWQTYRDQWISEALANYCSLMELEATNPSAFHRVLDDYRQQLLKKSDSGREVGSVGPVTLGVRLASSQSPDAYEPIIYGRGTWLIHMLRMMLRDAAGKKGTDTKTGDERFVQSLLNFRNHFEGKAASTQDLLASFEQDLPPELKFEDKNSLDWFLHDWVEGTAIPHLSIHSVKFAPKGNAVEVRGVIQQKNAPADLVTLVPIYAASGNSRTLIGQVFADGDETSFQLSAPAGTTRLLMDPDRTILSDPR
jgi:Peptidase family M1 domain